jgi:hypothetical protein
MSEHNYVNDSVIAANRDNHRDPASMFDVFDMRKYHSVYYFFFTLDIDLFNLSTVNLVFFYFF